MNVFSFFSTHKPAKTEREKTYRENTQMVRRKRSWGSSYVPWLSLLIALADRERKREKTKLKFSLSWWLSFGYFVQSWGIQWVARGGWGSHLQEEKKRRTGWCCNVSTFSFLLFFLALYDDNSLIVYLWANDTNSPLTLTQCVI